MVKTISTDELKARLDAGEPLVLIEALPERYFRDGRIPGAVNLADHQAAAEAASRLAPDKAQAVVLYCASETCRNSHVAAAALERAGYTDVAVYAGGKQAWEAAGHAFEREVEAV